MCKHSPLYRKEYLEQTGIDKCPVCMAEANNKQKSLLDLVRENSKSQWNANVVIWLSGNKTATLMHNGDKVSLVVSNGSENSKPLQVFYLNSSFRWAEVHDLEYKYKVWARRTKAAMESKK